MGYDFVLMVVSAVITGVFGGILRDIFCNRIPLVLQKEFYAGVSMVVASMYYVLIRYTHIDIHTISVIVFICGVTLRVIAIRYRIGLPVFNYEEK